MIQAALTHWKSSLFGILAGSLGALAVTAGVDQMSGKQLLAAYATCLLLAIKGLVSADAKPEDAPKVS